MLQPMGVINTEIHTTYIFFFSLRLFLNSTYGKVLQFTAIVHY